MSSLSEQALLSQGLERLKRKASQREATNLSRYQTNPYAYAKEVLGVWWWKQQREVAEAIRDYNRVLVMAAHGVGKTHVVGGLVNWYYDVFPDSTVITTAPTFDQVEKVLWGEIRAQRKTQPPAGNVQIRDTVNPLHYAVGRSPSKRTQRDEFGSQAFQGTHGEHLLVVFDEGAGVSDDRWKVVDGGLIVGSENRFLVIGNPVVTAGAYYDAAKDPRWKIISISALDHPNIAAGLKGMPDVVPGAVSLPWLEDKLSDEFWVEKLGEPVSKEQRERWLLDGAFEFPPESDIWYNPGPEAEARILGRFPSDPINTIWNGAWLDKAGNVTLGWAPGEPWEIGIDVARFGDDSTAVHSRRGPCSITHDTWRKMTTMETAGKVLNLLRSQEQLFGADDLPTQIILRVDTTGGDVGAGVADRLKEVLADFHNVQIKNIGAAERPRSVRKYKNVRSELWFTAAAWGQAGDLDMTRLPERIRLKINAQLTSSKYTYDSVGKRVVEPKKDVKERIGRSPDDADAFNLAYYSHGREYQVVNYGEDLGKDNPWQNPNITGRWHNAQQSTGRQWAVGTSTRRRFS